MQQQTNSNGSVRAGGVLRGAIGIQRLRAPAQSCALTISPRVEAKPPFCLCSRCCLWQMITGRGLAQRWYSGCMGLRQPHWRKSIALLQHRYAWHSRLCALSSTDHAIIGSSASHMWSTPSINHMYVHEARARVCTIVGTCQDQAKESAPANPIWPPVRPSYSTPSERLSAAAPLNTEPGLPLLSCNGHCS